MNSSHTVLGVMAGSSMDGLDMAKVCFHTHENTYDVLVCAIVDYPNSIKQLLQDAPKATYHRQLLADELFGKWIGEQINQQFNTSDIDLIATHGHTIMHDPEIKHVSWQIGNGQNIADLTKTATITAFRNKDISLGGQGAPLVPKGDFDLFDAHDACLNLGGIANISIKKNSKAWDICPCNQVLNLCAKKLGFDYDQNGELGRKGIIDPSF